MYVCMTGGSATIGLYYQSDMCSMDLTRPEFADLHFSLIGLL